jgi:hypothetical protein
MAVIWSAHLRPVIEVCFSTPHGAIPCSALSEEAFGTQQVQDVLGVAAGPEMRYSNAPLVRRGDVVGELVAAMTHLMTRSKRPAGLQERHTMDVQQHTIHLDQPIEPSPFVIPIQI